jgi:thermitase
VGSDWRPAALVLAFSRACGSTLLELLMRILSHWLLAWTASMCLLASGLAPGAAGAPPHSPDEVLVQFHPGTPGLAKRAAHAQAGGEPERTIAGIEVIVVRVPAGSALERAAVYQRNPSVAFAEPNGIHPLIIPGEGVFSGGPLVFDEQWNLHNTGQGIQTYVDPNTGAQSWPNSAADADIDAPEAWDVSQGDANVWIAVVDSGVDCGHGELVGKCMHEEDHVAATVDSFGTPIPEGVDRAGHGTHVAGTIAMATDNQNGGAGVGWNVSIGAFKVCYQEELLGLAFGSSCEDADIAAGIVAASDHGYHVINMSFGGGPSSTVQAAIDYADAAGVLLVAASGNDNSWDPFYPAAYPNVLSVGSTNPYGDRSSFSNFSRDADDWVDILAPGDPILAPVPRDHCIPADPQCFSWKRGTSMAAPHASGVAGLVWSHLLATDPGNASAATVRQRIQNCADGSGALGQNLLAWSRYGGLNANGALGCGGAPPPPPPPSGDPVPPVHVADLDASSSASGPNWSAQVTITLHDANHAAVEGAVVTGSWSATGGSGSSACTTEADGRCAVAWSGMRKKDGSAQYGVSSISGFAYDSGANHDPDGDSDGTSIGVSKP